MVATEESFHTQGFDNVDGSPSDCDICLEFSLYLNPYSGIYTIDMSWTYDSEKFIGEGGYAPVDGLGLYYNPQQWDVDSYSLSDTTYTSDKGRVAAEDDDLSDGVPFTAEDFLAKDEEEYFAGLHVEPIGNYSPDERYVYGDYVHTWNTTETDYSIGISYPPGVSISFSTSDVVHKESTATEGDGDTFMKLSQSDIVEPT